MKNDKKGKAREAKQLKKHNNQEWDQMNDLPKKEQLIKRRKFVYDMLFKGDQVTSQQMFPNNHYRGL